VEHEVALHVLPSYAHANHCGTDVPADAFAFACTVDDSLGTAERPDICA